MSARATWWLLVAFMVAAVAFAGLWTGTILTANAECRDTGGYPHRVSPIRVDCRYRPLE